MHRVLRAAVCGPRWWVFRICRSASGATTGPPMRASRALPEAARRSAPFETDRGTRGRPYNTKGDNLPLPAAPDSIRCGTPWELCSLGHQLRTRHDQRTPGAGTRRRHHARYGQPPAAAASADLGAAGSPNGRCIWQRFFEATFCRFFGGRI